MSVDLSYDLEYADISLHLEHSYFSSVLDYWNCFKYKCTDLKLQVPLMS